MSEPSNNHKWLVHHELGAILNNEDESQEAAKMADFFRRIHVLSPKE